MTLKHPIPVVTFVLLLALASAAAAEPPEEATPEKERPSGQSTEKPKVWTTEDLEKLSRLPGTKPAPEPAPEPAAAEKAAPPTESAPVAEQATAPNEVLAGEDPLAWLEAQKARKVERGKQIAEAEQRVAGLEKRVQELETALRATRNPLLKRPEMDYAKLVAVEGLGPGVDDPAVSEQVEIQVRYASYLSRQREDIEKRRKHESTPIPEGFDFGRVRGLSSEVREKLERVRPDTVGQASRIPGMTPAAISLLLVYLKKDRQQVA